jgi:hypothetical protein
MLQSLTQVRRALSLLVTKTREKSLRTCHIAERRLVQALGA